MGELPDGWQVKPFGAVATFAAGRTPSRANPSYWEPISGDAVPWVTIGDMQAYRPVQRTAERVTERAIDTVYGGQLVPAGTLLMSFKLTIGRVATLGVDAVHNETIIAIRPRAGVNARYLEFFLSQVDYDRHHDRAIKGNTLNRDKIERIPVVLPPEEEQARIAEILSDVQHGLQIQDEALAACRELKQVAMAELFTRGLRAETTQETAYGSLPESWPQVPLSNCCTVQSGVTKGRKLDASETVEVPYLRVANVQDGWLDLREVKTIAIRRDEVERYRLRHGDVLLTEGGDFDKLGRGFVWHGEIPDCVHQNHVFAVRANRDVLLPAFLAYLAQSPYGKAYFLTVAHKTTNLASINSTKLKALPVPLPPLDEQRGIVDVLRRVDDALAVHERKRALLAELFDTLLDDLMTGRRRVPAMPPGAPVWHDLDIDIVNGKG